MNNPLFDRNKNIIARCNEILEDSYVVFSHYGSVFSYEVPPLRALEQTLCYYFLDITSEDTILDIGPGYNVFTYYSALRNNCSLDLIDVDKKVISYHKSNIRRCSFSNIQAHRIKAKFPGSDKKYSKIFCISTFEHIPNSEYIGFLKEVDRVLQSKGKIVFSFPYTSRISSTRMIETPQFTFPEITFNAYLIRERIIKQLNYSIRQVAYVKASTKNIMKAYSQPYNIEDYYEIIKISDTIEKASYIDNTKTSPYNPLDGTIIITLEKP